MALLKIPTVASDEKFRREPSFDEFANPYILDWYIKSAPWKLPGLRINNGKMYWVYDKAGLARTVLGPVDLKALGGNLYAHCPLCGDEHPETETNPNACPMRPRLAKRRCPVTGCHRLFYDYGKLDPFNKLTVIEPKGAQSRLKTLVETHIFHYHWETAARMGITHPEDYTISELVTFGSGQIG